VPIFYYDISSISAAFLTPLEKIKALLLSLRMKPLRVTPWHGLTVITAYEYRDCDLGPYNEVSISFPITIDKTSSWINTMLGKTGEYMKVYIRHLPVTTEIARAVGVDFAGFPKFIAQIEFVEEDGWCRCRLSGDQGHILTLGVRQLPLVTAGRSRVHSMTLLEDKILRLEFVISESDKAVSRDSEDFQLELGDHQISQELKELGLGRMSFCTYAPKYQAILSPILESMPNS
jgi:hypothetical protein